MFLAVDIGNSNLVFGIYTQDTWTHTFRAETSQEKHAEAYALELTEQFLEHNLQVSNVQKIVLSSVVPPLTEPIRQALEHLFGLEVLVLNAAIYPHLGIGIASPNEIGADLVANALAAYTLGKGASIVVDFGTALTFTAISAEGDILGVNIAPGLKTAMYSLFQKTAQLPLVPLELPQSLVGSNTSHALQVGVLWGYVGLVKFLLQEMQRELGGKHYVIATGGLSKILPPLAEVFDEINPQLTLDGLRAVAARVGSAS